MAKWALNARLGRQSRQSENRINSLFLAHWQAILAAHLQLILKLKFLIDKVTFE